VLGRAKHKVKQPARKRVGDNWKMAKSNFWRTRRIFPSITTTKNSNWREKIRETADLKLTEVCVFLTGLDKKQRNEFYCLLEKSSVEKVPLVHLKSDMSAQEMDYFIKNYQTVVFNTHSQEEYPFKHNLDKYKKFIFIENTVPYNEREIKDFAGPCLDFSHLENSRLTHPQKYKNDIKILEKYVCGCNHISAIIDEPFEEDDYNSLTYQSHFLSELKEMDYLKNYPKEYFSGILALELENTIVEQIKIRYYVKDLLKDKI